MSSKYTVPKLWGPYYWFVMRCVANNYPDNPSDTDITQTRQFYTSLQFALPCNTCKKTYGEHLIRFPLSDALRNKESLVNWVEHIHNETQKIASSDVPEPITKNQSTKNHLTKAVVPHTKSLSKILTKQVNNISFMQKPAATKSFAPKPRAPVQTKSVIPQAKLAPAPKIKSLAPPPRPAPVQNAIKSITTAPKQAPRSTPKLRSLDMRVERQFNANGGGMRIKKMSVTRHCNCGRKRV